MTGSVLLTDSFARVQDLVRVVVDGLFPQQLTHRVDPGANTIAWLVWHLARVEDDHVAAAAEALGRPGGGAQVWVEEGFARRFDLPFDDTATGYGHTSEEVAEVTVDSAALLREYYDAVHAATLDFVAGLSDADLDAVVDERWDPPVTLGARLVSVIGDTTQHAGQAAFIRGVLERSDG